MAEAKAPVSYSILKMNDYKTPILSSVFNILGALVLLGALLCVVLPIAMAGRSDLPLALVPAIGVALAMVLTALIYFGIAQAIDYLGRTAHSTHRLCHLIETTVVRRIQSIESRLDSSMPIRVRVDQDKARFYHNLDGKQEGPFTEAEMRDLRESGVITVTTPVFCEGDAQWRTFLDFPDLVRK